VEDNDRIVLVEPASSQVVAKFADEIRREGKIEQRPGVSTPGRFVALAGMRAFTVFTLAGRQPRVCPQTLDF
jgi:hypothetical protein